ncbi:response regulator transcription factor [Vibrio sp. MEBiC08052]|uniref:response regulator transcription factor n=1 Tax=Vibrio sp. MEBiC08052 TaxID=1761910 RepID=UPI0012FC60A2|nr:helix-turn-helix transcriptional regulator [Vibrio sp. MEBiC08052]
MSNQKRKSSQRLMDNNLIIDFPDDKKFLIDSCRTCLVDILEKLDLKHKAILLFDESGILLDVLGSASVSQWFFKKGYIIGECPKVDLSLIGKGHLSGTSIAFSEYKKYTVDFWTVISGNLIVKEKCIGEIQIFIDIDDDGNHCYLVMELVVKYLSSVLEKEMYGNSKIDKILFFGYFSLNSKYKITPKEVEVLYNIYLGYSISELPQKLGVSINTVKTHIKNIYAKFDVSNMTECLNKVNIVLDSINK